MEINPKKQIITLFGCGGDRDKNKRPMMAEIAEKNSHKTIITNDNPRYENPQKIINEIVSGFKTDNHDVINDREIALEQQIKNLNKNQILVVLGKGIENYQIIKNKKIYHSDSEIVESLI